MSILIRGGTIVTMNEDREVAIGDLRIEDEKIAAIGASITPKPGEEIIDARGTWIIPGLIQTHTHLCQSLFRGLADDLQLLDWLRKRSGRLKKPIRRRR